MIILFKYCADMENCGNFEGFGFIYIYITRAMHGIVKQNLYTFTFIGTII